MTQLITADLQVSEAHIKERVMAALNSEEPEDSVDLIDELFAGASPTEVIQEESE